MSESNDDLKSGDVASDEDRSAENQNTAPSVSPHSIEGLFLQALQKPLAEREAFLHELCGNDAERLQRVTALLRAYDDAGSFLETPVGGRAGRGEDVSLSFLKPTTKDGSLGMIGPYDVLEIIGRGGMGVVLRAIDPKLNRVVAVKALLPELAANPNARRRFLREAQAAAAISHPHVVTIHAVDDAAEQVGEKPVPPYLVMECVVGQSLQQKLDRVGPLRLAEILRISRQVAEGLAAAHRQGLIHRDIKPANILLENGVERVKITDFGLARAIDDITVTRTGEVAGTPQYMSPEQASGERVDHRSDLFSLGCLMYAMCTGHSPFRGDSIAHVIKRVTQDTPRPIAEQNPEVPGWLIEIIDCLLQKNPDHRFQTADGLVAILDQHLARIQHPTESGSHSAINQQMVGAAATVLHQPGSAHSRVGQPSGDPPRPPNELVGLDDSTHPTDFAIRQISQPWLSSPTTCLRGKTHAQKLDALGVLLIGAGATVLFASVAWMLLVAFDVIGASTSLRMAAGEISMISLAVTFVVIAVGLILRKQIAGHETWKDLFSLGYWSVLGPIGTVLWMKRQLLAHSEALPAGTVDSAGSKSSDSDQAIAKSPWSPLIRMLTLLIGLVLGFFILVVIMIAIPAIQVVMARSGARLVIHHTADLRPGSVHIGEQPVLFQSQTDSMTTLASPFAGEQTVRVTVPRKNGLSETVTRTVQFSQHRPVEIDLRLPLKFHKANSLGPANTDYGGLILEFADPGLRVMLLSHGPGFLGFYPEAIPAGQHQIPVGKYTVLILDTQAGWLTDVRTRPDSDYSRLYDTIGRTFGTTHQLVDAASGNWLVTHYTASPPLIEIKPGEFTGITARRDIQRIALASQPADGAERFAPGTFHQFLWNGRPYSLTSPQAIVVDALLQAYASDKPSVPEQELIARIAKQPSEAAASAAVPVTLQALFNDGKHPAWNDLIQATGEGSTRQFSLKRLEPIDPMKPAPNL